MRLQAISGREASIFACVTDAVVAPEPVLPPVRDTDAAAYFDRWMSRSPKLNRLALRALLWTLELGPLGLGGGKRLRRLPPEQRALFLRRLEKAPQPQLRQLLKLVKGIAFLSYYGDDGVMLRLGYDADANVARGRRLRREEGRP